MKRDTLLWLVLLSQGGALPAWYLADRTISISQIAEWVENPLRRQLYDGGTLATAWTVSLRTNLEELAASKYAFDSLTGRVAIGVDANVSTENGFLTVGAMADLDLFATGDHTYMLVSSGSSIQAYRDNEAVGDPVSSTNNIGGTVRWGSRYSITGGAWYDWPVGIRAGHVAKIALSATQRAKLHASMMALPASDLMLASATDSVMLRYFDPSASQYVALM